MTIPDQFDLPRRLVAEGLGTALLVATIVGSGIMGEQLAGGNAAIALLGNTLATGAMLIVLISVFGKISGAHFNPVVSLSFAVQRRLSWHDFFLMWPFKSSLLLSVLSLPMRCSNYPSFKHLRISAQVWGSG